GRLDWKIEDDHHYLYYDIYKPDFPQHFYYDDNFVVLLNGRKKDTVAKFSDSILVREDTVEMNNPLRKAITTWEWSGDSIRTSSVVIDDSGKRTSQKGDLTLHVNGISARTMVALLGSDTMYGFHFAIPAAEMQRRLKKYTGKIFWQALTNDGRQK
ncbi:MAG TPA: hypothetical protein VFJ29_07170, partial [Candidatus Kapabacteria bacterium]|nr:hypothetical protein [Candidatus Kapabacteria bacterium]